MANRHLSRSIAMQSIFEWDFRGKNPEDLDVITKRNIEEFGPGLEETDFIWRLVNGVKDHLPQIDTIIERAAPEWPIEMIATIDRNLLRLGLYELLFGNREEVPPKVAINEAIELAKSFGSDSSFRFVNGVLGTVYREIGEPGKEHPSRHEKKEAEKQETSDKK
ncbi:MAG: transcription antitermination factor NusB [Candidatus Sungbacteria bacterium]|uniref:Transcription antitermination protein NusB n=1 Tax=Candidatus Sungiibacteriota bacterium TaxID=2750080 RepID=A0A9D6QZ15_9BACT|nr:transcription antitermination factor NusB [Candidatus Sungbacteria bacterium]